MDLLAPLLLQLAVSSPLYLLWLVGIVLAALRWREPRFRLVVAALALLLVLGIVGNALSLLLPITMQRRYMSAAEIGGVLTWVGIVRVLLEGLGWVMLLVALFRRTTSGSVSSVAQQDQV